MDFSQSTTLSLPDTEEFLKDFILDEYCLGSEEVKQEFNEQHHQELVPNANAQPAPPLLIYAQQPEQPPQPPSEEQLHLNVPSQVICNDFAGDAEFEVYINPHHGKKSPWMYSSPLGKIFISMNQVFPIDFKCRFPADASKLFIRATPVFSDAQHKHLMVTRCANHAAASDGTNKDCPEWIRDHVVRCQDRHTKYGGSKRDRQHLYARIPLLPPPAGSDSRQLHFQFMCKNSCASEAGMNRRATEVVFALENEAGETLGRRVLKVRVCSCPKRDKMNEERTFHHSEAADAPHAKKRKLEKKQNSSSQEMVDSKAYKLELSIPGASAARASLRAVHGAISSQIMMKKGEPALLKKCLEEIEQKLNAPFE